MHAVTEIPVTSTPISTIKLPVLVAIKCGSRFQDCYKVVVVGNQCAGKTLFILSTCGKTVSRPVISTIGIDINSCNINTASGVAKFLLWDTGGAERFRAITAQFYPKTHLVFIMANSPSVEPMEFWCRNVQEHLSTHQLFTVFYDGKKILLKPYTRENLCEALKENVTPLDLGKTGQDSLTKTSELLLTPVPISNGEAASSAATTTSTTTESIPATSSSTRVFQWFSTLLVMSPASAAESSDSSFSTLAHRNPDLFFTPIPASRRRLLDTQPGGRELIVN